MVAKFLVKVWKKLDSNPAFYLRLVWNVLVLRRAIVLVDFQGSLGDLVCFCASLPGLRERHGRCWIVFVTADDYLSLVRSTGLVDAAAAPYGLAHFCARRLCRMTNYYTPLAVSTGHGTGKNINPAIHTAAHFAQLLGVEPRMEAVHLRPSDSIRERMKSRVAEANPESRPVIVVHVGPTWTVKEWPAASWDEWSELVRRNLQVCVIQIGTEASTSVLHNHAMSRLPHAIDWRNRLNVMESAALLEQARVFLGIDSGPLHLATTLGILSVGLFGPVRGDLRAHPRAAFSCLTANVPCLGCHHDPAGELHWRTGCPYDIRCMRNIAASDVYRAVKDALESAKSLVPGPTALSRETLPDSNHC